MPESLITTQQRLMFESYGWTVNGNVVSYLNPRKGRRIYYQFRKDNTIVAVPNPQFQSSPLPGGTT